jgi:hypothetical protein
MLIKKDLWLIFMLRKMLKRTIYIQTANQSSAHEKLEGCYGLQHEKTLNAIITPLQVAICRGLGQPPPVGLIRGRR